MNIDSKRTRRNVAWGLVLGLALIAAIIAIILSGLAYSNRRGIPGVNGTCTGNCLNGTNGIDGVNGTNGLDGNSTIAGASQYIYTTQSPNDSRAPGTMFLISSVVYNGIPSDVVISSGAGGSVFSLTSGVYMITYECSLGSAGSIALYSGATIGSMAAITNSIIGSSTATTWLSGVYIQNVPSTLIVGLSSYIGTASVVTAGTASGFYVVRITFVKLA